MTRSLAFAAVTGDPLDELAVDLGSGGGLPGLVLALRWPSTKWLLIDSNARRATWLQKATEELGISSRADVRCERAELTGRSKWRQTAGLVTARSFGLPAATAECAAPLLRVGGRLLVADPPEREAERWPEAGLAELGLQLEFTEAVVTEAGPVSITGILSTESCGPRYPAARRDTVQAATLLKPAWNGCCHERPAPPGPHRACLCEPGRVPGHADAVNGR